MSRVAVPLRRRAASRAGVAPVRRAVRGTGPSDGPNPEFPMRSIVLCAAFVAASAAAVPAWAQTVAPAAPAAANPPAAASAAAEMADGEVRRVDLGNRKVTLRHGEIRSLQMPPMTMVFEVRDPSLLVGLKPGDKVRFSARQVGSAYVVDAVEPVR